MSDDVIDELIQNIREHGLVHVSMDGVQMTLTETHLDDLMLAKEMRRFVRENYEKLRAAPVHTEQGDTQ